MHIVIVGGGAIGKELASNLVSKKQTVAVVEKDPRRISELEENPDVLVIHGNGADIATLERARIGSAQMLIAVTTTDEVNMIACMVAKRKGVPITVARTQDPEHAENEDSRGLTREQIGIDFVISPERAVAQEIVKMIFFPDAEEIEYFAEGKVMMVRLSVTEESEIADRTLKDLQVDSGFIVAGIKRSNGDFVIPGGEDQISKGDKVYLIGSGKVVQQTSWLLPHGATRVHKVLILGGGKIGQYLASLLESNREHSYLAKIIEKDADRCEELNRVLSKTIVLQGDDTDCSFFNREEVAEADVLVTVTGDDRTNIVASVMGQKLGVKKIISEVNDIAYRPVYATASVDNAISPHLITAAQILRLTRSEDLVSLSILKNEEAETMELVLPASAPVAGKKVADVRFPNGMLIGTVVRDGEVIIPHGGTTLQQGDHLIVFALPKVSNRLDRFFAGQEEDA
ncbi:MAG: Trk system potassium transporter TrkA [Spirochaetaceae bacterium]|nr:MAG: Trk system potassium transporter TrkA [Spirochaetaceae bacterium]